MKYRVQLYYVRFGHFDLWFHVQRKKHWWNRWETIEMFKDRELAIAYIKELEELEEDKKRNHTSFPYKEWLYLRNRIKNQKW